MTSTAQHTPTPYGKATMASGDVYLESNDRPVALICGKDDESRATSNFIVRACNAHDELVSHLDFLVSILEDAATNTKVTPHRVMELLFAAAKNAELVLAKARGQA